MTLYQELMAAGVPVDNHESDLYFPATRTALDILNKYPLQESNAKQFRNQAPPHVGELWIDVPFAFNPFWEKRAKREYQPKTGAACSCRPGQERDNCPQCEGTGQRIDFAAIRARRY